MEDGIGLKKEMEAEEEAVVMAPLLAATSSAVVVKDKPGLGEEVPADLEMTELDGAEIGGDYQHDVVVETTTTTDEVKPAPEQAAPGESNGGGGILPNYNHQCYICDKIFSANSNLNRHLRKIHKENVQSPYNNVKCALCESVYSSSHIYNQHLENEHKVKIEVENLTFASRESFEDWKHHVENETTSQFIKSRGEKKTKNVNKTYYSCNRSGYYVSKARTRKALKKQGSRKINGRCPASINVTVNPDSTYDVRFVKTHVGHNFELKHLDLSDKDRELIVQKLVSGVPKKDIIKQLRSALDSQPKTTTATTTTTTTTTAGTTTTIDTTSSSATSNTLDSTATNNNNLIDQPNELPTQSATTTTNIAGDVEIVPTTSDTSVIVESTATVFPVASIGNNNNDSNQTGNRFLLSNSHPTSRLHLATTKDIHNIINSKHLDSKLREHLFRPSTIQKGKPVKK